MSKLRSGKYLLLAVLSVMAVSGIAFAEPVVQASFSVNPSVVYPGSNGAIQMTLSNTGSGDATSVTVSVTSVDPGMVFDSAYTQGINLGGVARGSSTSTVFKFSVPQNTQPGMYRVGFLVSYCQSSSACSTMSPSAIISVQSKSLLTLQSVSPSGISIGGASNITFTVANAGSSDLTNVIMSWTSPGGQILPIGMGNRIVLPKIPAGSQLDIPVQVAAGPSTTAGTYPISVTLDYFDASGAEQNSTSVAGIMVGGTTGFSVNMQDFSGNTVTLSIANIGVNPATAAIISVPDNGNLRFSGARSVYLGNLNPGDSTIASFSIVPLNGTSGFTTGAAAQGRYAQQQSISNATNRYRQMATEISYTDTSGSRQSVDIPVSIEATQSGMPAAAQSGTLSHSMGNGNASGGLNTITIIIVLLAVGLAAYVVIRRRNRKR